MHGMEPEPGGFVHHEELVVLVDDVERLDIRHERDGARRPAKHPAHPRRRDTTAQHLRHLRVAHSPFAAERERPRGVREGGFVSGDGGGGGGDVAPSVGRDGGDGVGATLGDVLTELVRVGRLYGLQTRWAGHGRALARSFGRAGRVVESPGDGRARGVARPVSPGGVSAGGLARGGVAGELVGALQGVETRGGGAELVGGRPGCLEGADDRQLLVVGGGVPGVGGIAPGGVVGGGHGARMMVVVVAATKGRGRAGSRGGRERNPRGR